MLERDGAGVVSIRPIGTGKTGLGIDILLLVLGVVLVLFNSYPTNTFTQTRVHTLSAVACVSYVVFISDSYTFVLSPLFLVYLWTSVGENIAQESQDKALIAQ